MGGQSNVYISKLFLVDKISTRGRWVVKKGIKSVCVVIEWPLTPADFFEGTSLLL